MKDYGSQGMGFIGSSIFKRYDPTKYKLKKDLPGLKAGAVFRYFLGADVWVSDGDSVNYKFTKIELQKSPDWFEQLDMSDAKCAACSDVIGKGKECTLTVAVHENYPTKFTVCEKCAYVLKKALS